MKIFYRAGFFKFSGHTSPQAELKDWINMASRHKLYTKPLELQPGSKGTQPHKLRRTKCFRLAIEVSESSQAATFIHTKCNAVDDLG